jgi:hypothetical protein
MFAGQNIPAGTSKADRVKIIAKRVKKLRKLVDSNTTVKESVERAASIARQVAIQKEVESNARFKTAVENFLLDPDK